MISQRHDQGSGAGFTTVPPRGTVVGGTVSLARQVGWYNRYQRRALLYVLWRLVSRNRGLRTLGWRRGIEGGAVYGDRLCHKPEVLTDLDEELADALWYAAEHIRRRHS